MPNPSRFRWPLLALLMAAAIYAITRCDVAHTLRQTEPRTTTESLRAPGPAPSPANHLETIRP